MGLPGAQLYYIRSSVHSVTFPTGCDTLSPTDPQKSHRPIRAIIGYSQLIGQFKVRLYRRPPSMLISETQVPRTSIDLHVVRVLPVTSVGIFSKPFSPSSLSYGNSRPHTFLEQRLPNTMLSLSVPVLHLLLVAFAVFVASQHVFIDQIPAYASLPQCAEVPLSFIVRDMDRGCGDDGRTTSYSCFCTASSSKMNGIISTSVASRCSTGPMTAASQALDVFSSYCGLGSSGKNAGNATSLATANATATITRTVTSTPSMSVALETALSPIPSSNLAAMSSEGKRVYLYIVAFIASVLGLSW
ncbi:hypothetical protein F4781DRAFT_408689 [Annulohypoxylon bovei var. microspora]|nr:hypothetical protein F4781DRAFT_408689 [Annulohypoxylon bovei var. microspora]